jgi:hypothetical protein
LGILFFLILPYLNSYDTSHSKNRTNFISLRRTVPRCGRAAVMAVSM